MKLLLDENLPHQMRHELPGHEVLTAAYMGWRGIANGELLLRAATSGFDAVISNDRGLEYERNPASLPIAVVVMCPKFNTIESIRVLYPKLIQVLENLQPRAITVIK